MTTQVRLSRKALRFTSEFNCTIPPPELSTARKVSFNAPSKRCSNKFLEARSLHDSGIGSILKASHPFHRRLPVLKLQIPTAPKPKFNHLRPHRSPASQVRVLARNRKIPFGLAPRFTSLFPGRALLASEIESVSDQVNVKSDVWKCLMADLIRRVIKDILHEKPSELAVQFLREQVACSLMQHYHSVLASHVRRLNTHASASSPSPTKASPPSNSRAPRTLTGPKPPGIKTLSDTFTTSLEEARLLALPSPVTTEPPRIVNRKKLLAKAKALRPTPASPAPSVTPSCDENAPSQVHTDDDDRVAAAKLRRPFRLALAKATLLGTYEYDDPIIVEVLSILGNPLSPAQCAYPFDHPNVVAHYAVNPSNGNPLHPGFVSTYNTAQFNPRDFTLGHPSIAKLQQLHSLFQSLFYF
jgi:hypothetical protein